MVQILATELSLRGTLILAGTGSPEGAVTAPVGSEYHRVDGGTNTALYVKTSGSGNTGWEPSLQTASGGTSSKATAFLMGT